MTMKAILSMLKSPQPCMGYLSKKMELHCGNSMESFTYYIEHCFQLNALGYEIKAHLHTCNEAQRENGC